MASAPRACEPGQRASRTFVVANHRKVVGHYALASGAIAVASSVGRFRRNMPGPIPVAVLGRLAVDRAKQGRGLGRALFRDCALRVAQKGVLRRARFRRVTGGR